MSAEYKRTLVDSGQPGISLTRQCELLGIARSGLYYVPVPMSVENLTLLRVLDEVYTKYPFFGTRRMTHWVRDLGHPVNRKRIVRLMQELGLEAIYPGPRTTIPIWSTKCIHICFAMC